MSESDPIISSAPTVSAVRSQLISCILSIAYIAIGAVYLHDCPRQPLIPIYLLVLGVFGLLMAVLPTLTQLMASYGNYWKAVSGLVSLFSVCWFIAGNVWIYSIYKPNYNKNTTSTDPYCDRTLYLFAFWTTTVVYILLAPSLLIWCCILICFCSRVDPDDEV